MCKQNRRLNSKNKNYRRNNKLQEVDYLRVFKRLHVLEIFVSGGWGSGKKKNNSNFVVQVRGECG